MNEMMQNVSPFLNLIPLGLVIFMFSWIRKVEGDVRSRTKKDYADENFQTIKLCNERSGNIQSTLKEIKNDVKEILRRNGG